jgi:acyl-CoA hydrolase
VSRRKLALALLAALIGAISVATWAWSFARVNNWPIKNDPPAIEGPVVAFGDSYTYGYGAPEGEGYVDVLARLIGQPIIADGVPGATSGDSLARLDDVAALRPRIALVFLGGNDILRQRPKDEMRENARTIVRKLHEGGALVVVVGIDGFPGFGEEFDKELRRMAREEGAVFVPDGLVGILDNPALRADPLHPDDKGYQKLARRIDEHAGPWLRK